MSERYKRETVVVTGGLGFVGRNLVDGLLQESAEKVIVVDDCSNSSPHMPAHWENRVDHINTSVTSDEWLDELASTQSLFHLACKTVLECHDNPVYDAEVNALSTLRILERLRALGDAAPSLIYTSSACVYGVTPYHAVDETYPTNPSSQYGVSKLAAEQYVQMYARTLGISAAALRLSNVYGPGQTSQNPYCGVIGKFLDQAASEQPLTVVGDGSQSRDFTFVDDTVKAILDVDKNADLKGEVFNVSNGTATTVSDIAREVQELFPGTTTTRVPLRPIDDIHYRQLNSEKLHQTVGWRATTSLHSGILATAVSLHPEMF